MPTPPRTRVASLLLLACLLPPAAASCSDSPTLYRDPASGFDTVVVVDTLRIYSQDTVFLASVDTVQIRDTVEVSARDTVFITGLDSQRDTTRLVGALSWGDGPIIGSSSHIAARLPDGRWGIGTDFPRARLHIADGEFRLDHESFRLMISGQFQGENPAGFGLTLDRDAGQGLTPMGITFQQQGRNRWGLGMDEDSNRPDPDYVAVFETSVGDVFRFRTGGRAILGNGIGHPEPHHVLTIQDKNNAFIQNILNLHLGRDVPGQRYIRAFDGSGIPFAVGRGGRVGVGRDVSSAVMLSVAGEVEATAYHRLSDRALKTDITPLAPVLGQVRNLKPVRYRWREGAESSEPRVGLIAQEVEELFPAVVHTNDEGRKTVDYAEVSILLLQAFQELAAEVEALRNEGGG